MSSRDPERPDPADVAEADNRTSAPAGADARVSRRRFLLAGGLGGAGLLGAAALGIARDVHGTALTADASRALTAAGADTVPSHSAAAHGAMHPMPAVVGEVDHVRNGFNPTQMLTDFDGGRVSTMPDGRTLREFTLVAQHKTIEVVPGVSFPAWTFNGRVPGPTIRVTEGDRVRVRHLNAGDHPHSVHFHGVHPGSQDGVFDIMSGVVAPGGEYTYEFDAEPFGLHLYHCHTAPLAKHLAKGLYGAFIVDPKAGRPPVDHEHVMVMSGYDTDFDGANDFYMVNGIPFHYDRHPIALKVGATVRLYLVNLLEYDQSNSFHLHANFFHYFPTGTSLTPTEFTDTVAQMQGQRGILEFSFRHPGRYMFHAHKTEFAELGWTGIFQVDA